MLENGYSGRGSGLSEWLKSRLSTRIASWFLSAILAASICLSPRVAVAQSPGSSISAYADAIKQSTIAERIVAMERYLALSSGSNLRVDALEFLVWDHMRLNHESQSAQRARELMAIS